MKKAKNLTQKMIKNANLATRKVSVLLGKNKKTALFFGEWLANIFKLFFLANSTNLKVG